MGRKIDFEDLIYQLEKLPGHQERIDLIVEMITSRTTLSAYLEHDDSLKLLSLLTDINIENEPKRAWMHRSDWGTVEESYYGNEQAVLDELKEYIPARRYKDLMRCYRLCEKEYEGDFELLFGMLGYMERDRLTTLFDERQEIEGDMYYLTSVVILDASDGNAIYFELDWEYLNTPGRLSGPYWYTDTTFKHRVEVDVDYW